MAYTPNICLVCAHDYVEGGERLTMQPSICRVEGVVRTQNPLIHSCPDPLQVPVFITGPLLLALPVYLVLLLGINKNRYGRHIVMHQSTGMSAMCNDSIRRNLCLKLVLVTLTSSNTSLRAGDVAVTNFLLLQT